MRRIAITGIGALTPVGNTFRESWDALCAGRAGTGQVVRFDAQGLSWPSAGELKGFDPNDWVTQKDVKRLDRFVIYAYAAAAMAAEDAGLGVADLERAGLIVGSSRGGIGMIENAVKGRVTAYLMAGSTVSMAASYTAMRLGVKGHASGVSNACASGSTAMGEACRMIRSGVLDTVLAGGAEAPVTRLCFEGYGRAGALSKKGVSRPFDRARDGFVLAEGGAVLVLEEWEHALRRGAYIYAEMLGEGSSCDAAHPTVPDQDGQVRAVTRSFQDAGVGPEEIACVYAHATSTQAGDEVEAGTISSIYGSRGITVSAIKSMTGHMLGASGAFEAAVAAMTLREACAVPTAGINSPEETIDLSADIRELSDGAVVCHSFGFGGVNSVLVFGKAK